MIEQRKGKWRVRYRVGGRNVSRTFDLKADAVKAEAELRRMSQGRGLVELDRGRTTLDQHFPVFLDERQVSRDTERQYESLWKRYARETIGVLEIRDLTPKRLHEWMTYELNEVPAPSKRKAVALVQGVLGTAVVAGELDHNPMRELRKPKQDKRLAPDPFSIEEVEAIRQHLDVEGRSIVSVLAYAGLRPKELLSLEWHDIKDRTIRVWSGKTSRERAIHLYDHLREDLQQWQSRDELVFPGVDWRSWRRYVWKPALKELGIGGVKYRDDVPYRLRSTYVSLTLADGRWTPGEVALMAGHSLDVMAQHYAGLISEYQGRNIRVEDAVREVRG